MLVVNKMHIK